MAVHSESLHKALVDAGVFKDGDNIVRFVIDAQVGQVVRLYVQRFGTKPLEEIMPRELRDLEAGQIFESAPATRTEVGGPETKHQSAEREAATGTHLTQGEPQTVENG